MNTTLPPLAEDYLVRLDRAARRAELALTVGTFVLPVVGPLVGIVLVWGSTPMDPP